MTDARNMFYGASPVIFEKAKILRLGMTKHEKMLWEELKSNKISGLRFKAQHPIDTLIADFYCHKIKLVIEIDGDSHNSLEQMSYDENRAYMMNEFGIRVIRFSNNEIENNISLVLRSIKKSCHDLLN
ncbi:MAG: endonuclease domain-containing protein, partial [Bacteroidota bacterium]